MPPLPSSTSAPSSGGANEEATAAATYRRPFLKWAGGKFKILPALLPRLGSGPRLIEPFAGSGAVFLNAPFTSFVAADDNEHLIATFLQVQADAHAVLREAETLFAPETNDATAFYALREEFNQGPVHTPRHAALFVYLNRHCFNGLCRFNRGGGFNVPFGRYRAPSLPREEILRFGAAARAVEFRRAGFLETMDRARPGDVVYCDPPYAPLTPTANFTAYSAGGFGEQEQRALAEAARRLAARGVTCVLSNHDTPLTRQLYQGARATYLSVRRFISSDAQNRAAAPEVIAVFEAAR
jgi:DNA adenine methylase